MDLLIAGFRSYFFDQVTIIFHSDECSSKFSLIIELIQEVEVFYYLFCDKTAPYNIFFDSILYLSRSDSIRLFFGVVGYLGMLEIVDCEGGGGGGGYYSKKI